MLRPTVVLAVALSAASAQMQWVQGGPFPFHQSVSCYDSARDRIVAWWFGTHEFDGQSWITVPTIVYPGQVSKAAYDPIRRVSVMQDAAIPSVWEWDGAIWNVTPQSVPPGLTWGMCFHHGRGKVVELATYSQGPSADELWEWDGVQWSLMPSGAFPARVGNVGGMIYDQARDKLVAYGWYSGGLTSYAPETWEWDAANGWVQVAAGGPTTSWVGLVYDAARNVQVLLAASALGGVQTWERTGSAAWQPVTASVQGMGQSALYDDLRRQSVFHDSVAFNTWHWQPVHPATYDFHGPGCAGTSSTPSLTLTSPWTLPRLGNSLDVTLHDLPANIGGLFMGFSDQSFGSVPLPSHLAWIGMPGCYVRAAPEASVVLVGSGQTARLPLSIPNQAGLLGLPFFQQGFVFDAGANLLGVTMTNSMRGTIGRL